MIVCVNFNDVLVKWLLTMISTRKVHGSTLVRGRIFFSFFTLFHLKTRKKIRNDHITLPLPAANVCVENQTSTYQRPLPEKSGGLFSALSPRFHKIRDSLISTLSIPNSTLSVIHKWDSAQLVPLTIIGGVSYS